ncbi:ABC transporter ATP-binding protein [Mesorhizobium sp. M0053]|uniref:ABC transporter ATP-binding protein n=1 Tax=Mesorhizobium sp. M0053 TaxID=2956864 RepID=UPI00333BF36A
MPQISIAELTVDFGILGMNARSLRKRFLDKATGGALRSAADDTVVVRALDGVSLEISAGDRIGLVGHNGSGKSTMLRVLAGLYHPTGGTVTVSGTVGALLSPNGGMDMEATGAENIFLRGQLLGLTREQLGTIFDEIASFTELGEFLDLPMRTYSSGMIARLAFAVSTAISPSILLIDEGIGAGDSGFQEKVQKRVVDLVDRSPILVLASHDTSIIDRLCNRQIRLEHGKIILDQRT